MADVAESLVERGQAIGVENEIGLSDLYSKVDEGAWSTSAIIRAVLSAA